MKKRILSTLFGTALFVTAALSFQNAEAQLQTDYRTVNQSINTSAGSITYYCCESGSYSCTYANCSSINITIVIEK